MLTTMEKYSYFNSTPVLPVEEIDRYWAIATSIP